MAGTGQSPGPPAPCPLPLREEAQRLGQRLHRHDVRRPDPHHRPQVPHHLGVGRWGGTPNAGVGCREPNPRSPSGCRRGRPPHESGNVIVTYDSLYQVYTALAPEYATHYRRATLSCVGLLRPAQETKFLEVSP